MTDRIEEVKKQEIPQEVIEAIEDAKMLGAKWERERIGAIIRDWDEMGEICDGGQTWRAKYGSYFKPFTLSYIEELLQVIRQALEEGE